MPASVPPPTSALAQPGATLVNKYRLDALVGYGGMGSVWSATHLGLGHQIAIKLISQVHVQSPEVRRRFDTEAKAVARLKSRHVVQIYDNGELEDGTPFIAMELLHGESLHRRIHRGGPMPLAEVVTVIGQVCRALTKAHAAGITHRDIKPDNIFLAVSEDDVGAVAKVLDFGVAKLALNEGEQSSTQTGSLVGTPLYMSPEQARGLKNVDQRTDLYSLALVTYTMLSGNLAFSGESFGDLLLKICTQPLPSLRQGAPWLPPSMDAWFQRAAAREPQDRFQSAQELSDALTVAAGGSVVARPAMASVPDGGQIRVLPPSALGESVTKQYERRSSGNAPAASASTITGATVQASRPPPGVRSARHRAAVAISAGAAVLLAGALAAFVLFGHRGEAPPGAGAQAGSGPAAVVLPPAPAPPVAPDPATLAKTDPAPPAATPSASGSALASVTASAAPNAPAHPSKHAAAPAPSQAAPRQPAPASKPPKSKPDAVDLGY